MNIPTIKIRIATADDVQAVGRLAVKLARQHQSYNSLRFFNFGDLERRYNKHFAEEFENDDAVILIAETDGQVVGYAYVSFAPESLIEASDARAWLDDIYVDEAARGLSAGKMLLQAAIEAAKNLGSTVLMLTVAPQNEFARKLFKKHGFQLTMQEMMLKLDSKPSSSFIT